MAEVEFRGVTKQFPNGVVAVDDLSLTIGDQEFMVLVGPSGCGKTTALRMVAGLEKPTSGEIAIGAEVVNDKSPGSRDIAMVFQNYALYPHMTVERNIGFGLRQRKMPRADIDARVREVSELLELDELLKRKPAQLSGGQRQRVAMGRALARHPQVFLLDEPLSNLDAKLRTQLRAELKKIHQLVPTTSVYVTHDQVEAMTLGDRVAVMSRRADPAARVAPGGVRPPRQPVRGRLHRQPADEPDRRHQPRRCDHGRSAHAAAAGGRRRRGAGGAAGAAGAGDRER